MNTESLKVSIIMPAYNDSKFILASIQSALSQTHNNLELIIVDDNSSDDTVNIIKSVCDNRIILIRNDKNNGAAFCRNIALERATGDYVAFLDADDIWVQNKIEKQLEFLISNNFSFCCTKYGTIDEEGKDIKRIVSAPMVITHKKMLKCSYLGCLTVMYKRAEYSNLRIPDSIKKRNDYALWLKLSEKIDCYFLDCLTAYYRKRKTNSVSSGKKSKLFKYHIELFQKLYGFSKFKSFLYSLRNVFYYFVKMIRYVRKH